MGSGSSRAHRSFSVAPSPEASQGGPTGQSSAGQRPELRPPEDLERSAAGMQAAAAAPRARGAGGGMGGGGGGGLSGYVPEPGGVPVDDLATATTSVAEELGQDHAASVAAQQAARDAGGVGESSWSDDPTAFQAAYDAARAAQRAGGAAVPFMTEDATGGLGSAQGGRAFGVEIEFDIDPSVDRAAAIGAIGRDLHAAGLTSSPYQRGYHARPSESLAGTWRFEADCTVHGEIVSPVMHDDPASWQRLSQVCDIVRRHGGRATARTGGHVHVGVGDFDHTVENHNNLLGLAASHEDVLYRLAQNPGRRAHRGTAWCMPNAVPTQPYRDLIEVRHRNSSHGTALNFQSVAGQRTDHVEFRMWDSSLDPGVIQAQVKLSLGMTQAAFVTRPGAPAAGHEPIGSHRSRNHGLGGRQRLRGDAWHADTASFRHLVDRIYTRDADKAQATALFAVTRWQRG
jgi:hypothetical protein